MTLIALFGSTYLIVFALTTQSLWVNNGRYAYAFANSFLIGGCNLALFKLAPQATPDEMMAFLSGGPLGVFSAMWMLRHLHRKPESALDGEQYIVDVVLKNIQGHGPLRPRPSTRSTVGKGDGSSLSTRPHTGSQEEKP